MKKIFNLAVAATIVALCAVLFVGCGEKYSDTDRIPPEPENPAKVTSCEVTLNTYQGSGVVKTRATAVENLDGKLVAISRHLMKIANATVSERTYSGTNTIEARGVLKTRYAKTLDSFKESNLRMSETTFEDGRVGKFINFADGSNHNFYYSFIIENSYDTDTIQVVNSQSGKIETLKRCINEIVNLEFLNMRSTDLQRDSAGWHAYSLVHVYSGRLSEGPNNGFTYEVNIPLVWVWKGTSEPEYPEEKPEIIVWEDGEEGFDYVNDSTSQSWKDIIPTLSNGTKGKPDRIAVLLKNRIVEPEYQVKTVEDFDWNGLEMTTYDEVKDGDRYDKENKISVQPYMKSIKTRTNKCETIFILQREGTPIYTDSLGGTHRLPERQWTATDDGWTDKKLDPSDNFERLLLTSHIIGTFNEHSHNAKGEVELKKVKGEEVKIIGYSYPEDEKGLETIVPNNSYKTWRNQYTVFSNGKKEFNGKVSTTLYLKTVVDPEKQTVTVSDWEINDLKAQPYDGVRGSSRPDKQETGTFTIYNWSKKYVTRTNKSETKFTTTYDGTVKFVDKYNNEVEFPALAVKQEDLGGTATLKPLNEENDYERKLMTTSIRVTETNTSTSANHTAEVLFHKAVEKEELLDWTVTKDLIDKGNGLWDTKADIVYTWKLKGTEHDPITQELDCSFKGEQKSHVILDKAEAPFNASNFNSAWSAETTSTPQQYVTLYTKTKSVSEDYTTLTDRYTAQMQRAVIKKTVGGKEIVVEMLAPSDMTFSHNEGNLVDGKRTTTEGGTTYDVYDHTGSVTATVTGNGRSQTQSATDVKEIWVKHEEPAIEPSNPEWGKPLGLLGQGTVVYQPGIGPSGQGVFYCNFNVQYEKGVVCYVTNTYIREGHTNPQDFAATGFWAYGSKLRGATLRSDNVGDLDSAIFRDGKFEPACCTYVPGKGVWTYMSPDGREHGQGEQGMTENLAETCGLKHFTGTNTAHLQPILYYTAKIENGALVVRNQYGGAVLSLR